MENTYPELTALLKAMIERGYTFAVHDSELWEVTPNVASAREVVMSVDESSIRFSKEGERPITVFIVLGNGPGEAICDHTAGRAWFDELVCSHYQQYSE